MLEPLKEAANEDKTAKRAKEDEIQQNTCALADSGSLARRGRGPYGAGLLFSQIIEEEEESESNLQSGRNTARSSAWKVEDRSVRPSTGRSRGSKGNPGLVTAGVPRESRAQEAKLEVNGFEVNLFDPRAMASPKN